MKHWVIVVSCLLCWSGCSLSVENKTACETSDDCIDGYTCFERVCKPEGSRTDASVVPMDGGMDASRDGAADGHVAPGDGAMDSDTKDASDGSVASEGGSAATEGGEGDGQSSAVDGCADKSCVDVDECDLGIANCDAHATCANTDGGSSCTCASGYFGSGRGSDGCSRKVVQLTAGFSHTCARFDDGRVKCWGGNDRGQLGLGDVQSRGDAAGEMGDALPAVPLGDNRTAIMISSGRKHTCALLDNGDVKCWGQNAFGQLGQGTSCLSQCGTGADVFDLRGDEPGELGNALLPVQLGAGRKATAIATGDDYTCALLDDKSVKCWGKNDHGQLGLGTSCLSDCGTTPVIDHRGDQPGEMGAALPAIELGTQRTAVAIYAGGSHTCALLDDNSIKCWGYNGSSELGLGDANDRGDEPNEMADNLDPVQLGSSNPTTLSCAGGSHTCSVTVDDSLKCWGYNGDGQLGLGDQLSRGETAAQMGDALKAVELGSGVHAIALACGGAHTCAVLVDGALKCWGKNDLGQIGQGDTADRGIMSGQMGDALEPIPLDVTKKVYAVAAGAFHTCAILDDGSVRCWGSNLQGQLGLGDTDSRGDASDELGGHLPVVVLGH